MEEATLSRRASFLVLLLILLLHGSLLLFLLFAYQVALDKPTKPISSFTELFQKQPQSQDPQDEWVATYGRAGAPVIFADAPTPGTEQPMAVAQQSRQDPLQANPVDKAQPVQKKGEEPQDKKIEIAQEQNEQPIERSPLDLIAQHDPPREEKKSARDAAPQALTRNAIDQAFDTAAQSLNQQPSRSASGPSGSQTSQPAQKKLSLAQLAQGFAQHLANEGNDDFSSAGKATGKVTAEQIMFAHYNDKISECLTNSLHIHKDKFYLTQNNQTKMALLLEIARDGSIKNLEIVSGSGIPYVDKFMLFVFRDAASSFPPLPTHFKEDTFKTIRTFSHAIASIKNPSAGYWTPVR